MKTFYHGGDYGDVIYSLPFVMSEGGGDLLLGCDPRARLKFNPALVENIAALLRAQPYLFSVSFVDSKPAHIVDLTRIRNHWPELKARRLNLAQSYFHVFGKHYPTVIKPWLKATPVNDHPVLVARSARWNDPTFDWPAVLVRHPQAVFVGLPDEHLEFVARYGRVPYAPTDNLLELACLIAGADLFVGNQSAPMAIAVGLGIKTVTEYWPEWPNVFL